MFFPEKKNLEYDFFQPTAGIYLTKFEAVCIDRKSSSLLFSYGGRKNYGGVCSAETELKRNCNNNTNLVVNVKSDQKEGRREDEKQKVNYIHILDTIYACKNLVFGKQLYISNNKSAILLDFMAYIHF